MRATRPTRLVVVAALAVLCLADPTSAQTQVFGLNVEGEAEAGFRAFLDRPTKGERAKFEEYRDLPQRPFLDSFHLRLFRPDESYSFEFDGSKWGQEDQEFSLRAGRLGLWEFGFGWDQMRHVFSTDARMLAREESRGVFRLPADLAGRNAAAGLPTDGPRYNAAPALDEISVRWDTARISFKLTPTPDLEFKTEYTRIDKDGDRPFGVPFGFTFMEVLEPIEQTIHDARFQITLAREQWQLQFGYKLSIFQNALNKLIVDNPVRATDTATASASGQMSLPPDNTAHTFSLAGGLTLPWWRTRITSNFSYGLRLQNDDFLPHTRNPQILAAGPDLRLPQDSLNGNVQVFLYNLNLISRPLTPLTLSLKYRLYDLKDKSDVITFGGTVETDSSAPNGEDVRPGRWSYQRQNTDLDARWQIIRPLALTLGTGWERWVRNEHREVRESDEFFGRLALDLTPFDWLLARLKYVPSFRRIPHYNAGAHLEHTTLEDPGVLVQSGQSPFLRKLDEADRDRHKVDFLLQLTPTDTLSVGPTFGYRYDDYVDSRFGLQAEKSWSAGMDANWTPHERVSLSAGYVHEQIFQKQRSRSRAAATDPFTDFDWISQHTDTVDTYNFRAKVGLIPKVLEWNTTANYAYALGRVANSNPRIPFSGTAAQREAATAKPWPDFEDSLIRIESALKYHFWKVWSVKVGYIFEEFEKHDFRTDTLNPFNPGANSIFLGNDLKDYTAHIMALTIGYRFK